MTPTKQPSASEKPTDDKKGDETVNKVNEDDKVAKSDEVVDIMIVGNTLNKPTGYKINSESEDFEWQTEDSDHITEPKSKLFKKVNEDESSDDAIDKAKEVRKKFLKQNKGGTSKRGRQSSGKAGKEDKKLKN